MVSNETLVRANGESATDLLGECERTLRRRRTRVGTPADDLRELIAARSGIEKSLALYDQIADLQRMKAKIEDDAQVDGAVVSEGLNLGALREFSTELSKRLDDGVTPTLSRFALTEPCRTFTLGLAQYCFDRDIAHPGFVVLDSPLVTYRPPDRGDAGEVDATLPAGIVAAFYKDVQNRFDGQVIIMENSTPRSP